MKRPPVTVFDNRYRIKYIQIPYDNRYHVVEYNESIGGKPRWTQVAKIPCNLPSAVRAIICGIADMERYNHRVKQLNRYWEKVGARDEYLDSTDG